MLRAVRRHRLQIALILGVFAVFVANALGMFDLALQLSGGLRAPWGPLLDGGWALPVAARSAEFATLLAAGLLLSVLLPIATPLQASTLTLIAAAPFVYLEFTQPGAPRPLIPMEYSLLTVLVLFVVNVLLSYFSEIHRKQELIKAFGHYVPPHVVNVITREPERFSVEGEAREVSVLFCDVHDFTAISEDLGPKQLVRLLNTLFTPLSRVIYKHAGTIDKYIGDAVMAFWGAPVDDPQHARHALAAAFDMQAALRQLQPAFRREGWPPIRMGIGLNSGVVNVGNMGSEYRMAYTVIGDAVNLAARLQELTKIYEADVIVGQATRDAVPEMLYRELDRVQVKGKHVLTRIYQPLGPSETLDPALVERTRHHHEALRHYYAREWDRAAAAFEALRNADPGDPLYGLYLERIAVFREDPPPDDWQGAARRVARI